MRTLINFVGLILIIIGIGSLVYNGFTYNKQEKLAEIGNLEVTATTPKTIYISPAMSGVAVLVGIVLIVIGRMGSKA